MLVLEAADQPGLRSHPRSSRRDSPGPAAAPREPRYQRDWTIELDFKILIKTLFRLHSANGY
jgi:lipopolysaccharide/colanic/teichoic acid biosynthesis glycosyltransferase